MKFVTLPDIVDKNLVVMAPTGLGKTTAIINNLENYKKQFSRIILCFPTKQLMYEVSEKLESRNIEHLLDNSDARLVLDIKPTDWLVNKIIVTSYEKADSMALMYPEILKDSLIFIDEVHLAAGKSADSTDRATSILSLMANAKQVGARIITASATIPNAQELSEYLNGELIIHNVQRNINVKFEEIGFIPRGSRWYLIAIVTKLKEILKDGKQTIIFRISRRDCEEITKILKEDGFKVATIHAGISKEEKEDTMRKFINKEIQVLVATHALTWGINTPAEKIVIAGILQYTRTGPVINKYIKTTDIAQMAGRAGRPGFSENAELVAIITDSYEDFWYEPDQEYYTEKQFIEKGLNKEYIEEIGLRGDLDTIILRLVLARRIKTTKDLRMIPETWFNVPPVERFEEALETLENLELVKLHTTRKMLIRSEKRIHLTKIGFIVAEMYMDVKTYMLIKKYILQSTATNSSRLDKLISVALVAGELRGAKLQVPEEAMDDSLVLSIKNELAQEVLAQFSGKITGDTNMLAEQMKRIAFFMTKVSRVFDYPEEDNNDWYILGKTMKMIRSMIYHNVPIKGVLGQYVDKKIDQFFVAMKEQKQEKNK